MTRFVIEEDGSTFKETINKEPINLDPQIDAVFQANAVLRVERVADFNALGEPFFGWASLSVSSELTKSYWSVHVNTLNLNCTFGIKEEVMYPTFEKEGKFMEVQWTPPPNMKLVLGISVYETDSQQFKSGKNWLIAYDDRGASWRLPLSNLYDHLELCHGQPASTHGTSLQAALNAASCFRRSPWNADLVGEWHRLNTPRLFRFKPTNSGFEQLPELGTWTSACQKASVEIVNKRMMPV